MSTIKERPILFTAPMVQAILEGRKTQTRRILKGIDLQYVQADKSYESGEVYSTYQAFYDNGKYSVTRHSLKDWVSILKCPYGNVGDELWVRENVYADHDQSEVITCAKYFDGVSVLYDGTHDDPDADEYEKYEGSLAHWWYSRETCPSIHMPRWASRIQLRITDIRIEQLKSVSEQDAISEGLKSISKDGELFKWGLPDYDGFPGNDNHGWPWNCWEISPISAFMKVWEMVHGEGSWNKNPWVWVVEFELINRKHGVSEQ